MREGRVGEKSICRWERRVISGPTATEESRSQAWVVACHCKCAADCACPAGGVASHSALTATGKPARVACEVVSPWHRPVLAQALQKMGGAVGEYRHLRPVGLGLGRSAHEQAQGQCGQQR